MSTPRTSPPRTGSAPSPRSGPALAVVVALTLGACGGGSGDGPEALPAADGSPIDPAAGGPGDVSPGTQASDGQAVAGSDAPVPFGRPPLQEATGPLPRNDVRGIDEIRPFRADSPWSEVLAGCALVEELEDACPLDVLPFIAQATERPSVDEVMDRVLVTHDWMGMRFEAMLRGAPDRLVQLFAPITSITIGSTVRPSFYTGLTGGVRLDPEYLWQSVEEKATVSIEEDYRAPFRALLAFRDVSASRIGEERAYDYFPLDDRSERGFDDVQKPLFRLLFHELAHANDYLPPGTAAFVDPALRPWEALDANRFAWLSPQLQAQYPQVSERLVRLADIRFGGDEPTEEEASLAADDVGAEFGLDGSTDFYAYSTIREDFARLFEFALMKAVFDVDVHVAFTDQPADPEDYACDELTVGWGARKRLGDPSVAVRAGWAVAAIYGPGASVDDFVAAQTGTQELMAPGVGFCTNLAGATAVASRSRGAGAPVSPPWEPMSDAERHRIVARRHGATAPAF